MSDERPVLLDVVLASIDASIAQMVSLRATLAELLRDKPKWSDECAHVNRTVVNTLGSGEQWLCPDCEARSD